MFFNRPAFNTLSYKRARSRVRVTAIVYVTGIGTALLCVSGCIQNQPQAASRSAEINKQAPAEIRLAIVDDPALAASIGRLQGEWAAQTNSKLNVTELSSKQIATAEKLDADAIIYPPARLGELAERKLIRPLNRSWLKGDPLESADLLQPLEALEFTWEGQPYAVPLGSPVFVLLYRADLFELFSKQPPHTWEEYQDLANFFGSASQLQAKANAKREKAQLEISEPWSGTIEPAGWGSRLLLARAAAYAKHRDYVSVFFDRETMEPLIAGPPFARALDDLVKAAKMGPKDSDKLSPPDALRQFLAGHAAMAIAWPAATAELPVTASKKGVNVSTGVVQLPGSTTAYNPRHSAWEPRRNDEAVNVPLRAISGRVGSVCRGADSPDVAFQLLAWLASKQWSSVVLPASPATTMFRHSQLADPIPWTGPAFPATAANEFGDVLAAALRQQEAVCILRIPGENEYLAALDDAVSAAIHGNKTTQEALNDAAAKWKEITARRGEKQQQEAYRRSLKAAP